MNDFKLQSVFFRPTPLSFGAFKTVLKKISNVQAAVYTHLLISCNEQSAKKLIYMILLNLISREED